MFEFKERRKFPDIDIAVLVDGGTENLAAVFKIVGGIVRAAPKKDIRCGVLEMIIPRSP